MELYILLFYVLINEKARHNTDQKTNDIVLFNSFAK